MMCKGGEMLDSSLPQVLCAGGFGPEVLSWDAWFGTLLLRLGVFVVLRVMVLRWC